jgi:hypothetical protein
MDGSNLSDAVGATTFQGFPPMGSYTVSSNSHFSLNLPPHAYTPASMWGYAGHPPPPIHQPLHIPTLDSGPTFVNAKQFRRIVKRRDARAKMEEYYKQMKTSKRPYMHESRHRHAMKRPRGPGGRFLRKEELEEYYKLHPEEDPSVMSATEGSSAADAAEP